MAVRSHLREVCDEERFFSHCGQCSGVGSDVVVLSTRLVAASHCVGPPGSLERWVRVHEEHLLAAGSQRRRQRRSAEILGAAQARLMKGKRAAELATGGIEAARKRQS